MLRVGTWYYSEKEDFFKARHWLEKFVQSPEFPEGEEGVDAFEKLGIMYDAAGGVLPNLILIGFYTFREIRLFQ